MISKISAVSYICTLYTQNKISWISMIVDDCSAYQQNTKSDISPYVSRGEYAHSNNQSTFLTNSAQR